MKFEPPFKSFNKTQLRIFLLFLAFLLNNNTLFAQTVSVNTTSNTSTQLVNMLMSGSCSVRSNISISSPQSVGYFDNNNSSFPINEGVIIRSGNALHSQGSYTGQNLSSQVNTNGDPDLQAISNDSGQISDITDVAFLEFDFIPNGTEFSFNFLFASNEYGEWQCGFSDVFAFLLTDLTTGETINLAVVPGTSTPISVKDIRDSANNLSCNSVNENLFSTYNVNDPSSSAINMRGHTVVMNASATVKPTHLYKIRLAVGDYNDSDFDSAVFIESGSFNTFIDLGDDQDTCGNEDITLDTQITDTVNYSFEWRRNGTPILGENNPTLTTDQTGTYDVIVTTSNNCMLTDQVLITDLQVNMPDDLVQCDNGANTFFDLTNNNEVRLGIDVTRYEVLYYNSLANANANIPIPSSQWSNYLSTGNETIYIRVRNRNNNVFCNTNLDFDLNIVSVTATTPNNFAICENVTTIDIPDQVAVQILNGLSTTEHTLNYFTTANDANNNTNQITDPVNFPTPTSDITIWARLSSNLIPDCFDIVNFNIQISSLPLVDTLPDVTECSSFTLPPLTNGNYFTEENGQGTQLNAGDPITNSNRIYIFNQNTSGCTNQTSFFVTIIQSYVLETEYCESFTVPTNNSGAFYTQPNGPNGTGSIIDPGTVLTSSQSIYFYAEFNNTVCLDRRFDIEIFPLPLVDTINDVIICNSYTLPALTNGTYYTGTGGTGNVIAPGTILSSSVTLYIYNDDGRCTNESSFTVNIVNIADFSDVTNCGPYTLPSIEVGGYFTEAAGNGTTIAPGTVINQSTTVYYHVETTEGLNCTSSLPIDITIHSLPLVSILDDVTTCIDKPYELPSIQHGNYFTQPNGQGNQLNAGDLIDVTQRIYIYNTNTFCSNQTFFSVIIVPLPIVSNFTDIFVCDPYTLPVLANGSYFTETNGQGTQLNAGDIIDTTQTIYIYNQDPVLLDSCQSETQFTVFVLGITVDQLEDVGRCDSYTLPELTVGDYFTEPYGQGNQLFAGDIITSTQTLYIYAENGNRFFCFDNHPFTVTITDTPAIQNFQNQESCGSYTLETLNVPGIDVNYYRQLGGVNLIDPSEYTLTEPGIYTIHARSSNSSNPGCFIDEVFSVTVYPLQELIIDEVIICVDAQTGNTTQTATLESGLDPNIYTVNWFLNNTLVGTGPNHEATEAGIYTVETIKLIPDVGNDCNYAPTEVEVRASSPNAKITFLTEPFEALSNIRVDFIDRGLGSYEYQLDNGSFQTSNIFLNIGFGEHVITIRDTSNLCGDIRLPFTTISHPVFFTPNGDGINDTWNIPDLSNDLTAKIKIYDRFGRFIKEIKPSEGGWNGFNNNGNASPSTSYWFKVEFTFEGSLTTYTSYFALERK